MDQKVFVTKNLKLAMALTAAGFHIRTAQNTVSFKRGDPKGSEGRKTVVVELEADHNGVSADYLCRAFRYDEHVDGPEFDLVSRVNEIIEARGITQEEYVLIAFDAARAGLHNASTIMFCVKNDRPLVAQEMKDGRTLIYKDGTPRDLLRKLIEES
jgi:hypothetical protein